MCGICGFFGRKDTTLLNNMCEALKHRGPDQQGVYVDDSVSLGHRRLSIIDLSENAKQPLFNEDKTVALVYNGEIYNFKELREELVKKGHIFRSNTDSEVIVHAYEEEGELCVKKFRGMFAFALYDLKERKLILARDRIGIKPLYYARSKDRFIFASEIKAILEDKSLSRQVNYDGYNLYLAFQCVLGEETMFKGINKLKPGHLLVFKNGEYSLKSYWSLFFDSEAKSNCDSRGVLREEFDLLAESVKISLVSDVPLGVLLSGGLDSSSIVGLIREPANGRIKTFTAGFNRPDDELNYADRVAKYFNTDHRQFIVKPNVVPSVLRKIVWHMDEPLADGGAIATFFVCEALKEYAKVVLVGEGSDEVFGGYSWHKLSGLPYKFLPLPMRKRLYFYLTTFNKKHSIYKKFVGMFDSEERRGVTPFFFKMSAFEIKNILPNSLLMKVDKMTMAHSIEARVPFLDHKLIEYLFSHPARLKKGIVGKKELRAMMRDILPQEILSRKKHGFILPVNDWLRGDLRDFCRETLLANNSHTRANHKINLIESLFKRETGLREIEKICLLWRLLIFEIWHNTYIKQ